MFHHLLWVLEQKNLEPTTRLAAVYLASNGTVIDNEFHSRSWDPTRHVSLKAVSSWIGCEEIDLIDVLYGRLQPLGFQPMYVEGDDVRYSLPELPDLSDQKEVKKLDPVISIYVFTRGPSVSKIGISKDVIYRLAGLQSANPTTPLTVAFQFAGPASLIRKAERKAHEMLAKNALGNEWFGVGSDQAIEVAKAALDLVGLKA